MAMSEVHATPFVDDVEKFIQSAEAKTVEGVLQLFQSNHEQYKAAEKHLLRNKQRVKEKMPDITQSLEAVRFLQAASEDGDAVSLTVPLADHLYANARIPPSGAVGLWLGANVMVEYTYEEAIALLTENLDKSHESLANIQRDLDFVKDNIITTEVNIARIYNYDVSKRREERIQKEREMKEENAKEKEK